MRRSQVWILPSPDTSSRSSSGCHCLSSKGIPYSYQPSAVHGKILPIPSTDHLRRKGKVSSPAQSDTFGPSSHTQKWQEGFVQLFLQTEAGGWLQPSKHFAMPRTFSCEIDHISLNSKHGARNVGLAMNSLSGYLIFIILDRTDKLETASKRKI